MLNPRLAHLPEYPFPRLRALLDPLPAPDGLTPVVMSIGEPQHAYPSLVNESLAANGHLFNKYPPNNGTPEFRRAVADWLTRRYGLPEGLITAERHVLPVSGTREALFQAALVFVPRVKAGRQPAVLMPNPFYQCYAGAAVAAGAEPIYLPTHREHNFLPDLAAIPEELLARTAMFYLCSPANPQGTVAGHDYLVHLIGLAREWDFVVAMDECYAEIYTESPPTGALEVCAATGGVLDNVLVFHSLSKRSNVAGLRSGFLAGDPSLVESFLSIRDYGGSPMPLPVQATSVALWGEESHVAANRALYREKFDLAERVLGNRFGFYRPAGGFFLWLDVGDGEAAARKLWTEAAVRVLPGTYLTAPESDGPDPGHEYIRLALVPDLEITGEALRRIAETL
ncbi:MAG: aminotransferase class I/II-fold pyridoxal phosphate-dependent enzyme [Alphaproteobacteria bacterium]|jgi:succinyldiaminopimelate transaminase|nr:aminotransferase class I/II-fold pyridoxal phosphate-dependent enzyme [Alphaproteobacteria bacterium]